MFWFMLLMNLLIPLVMILMGIYFKKANYLKSIHCLDIEPGVQWLV